MRTSFLVSAGSWLVLTACGGAGVNSGDGHTIVDSAGIRIVESIAPIWRAGTRRIEAEPVLRIGRADGDEAYLFGSITDALLLADGHIAVADLHAGGVRLFDSEGSHVRTYGRRGRGPGEFERLTDVFEYTGDSIAAFDQRLHRTTIFPRESGLPRTVRNPVEGNFAVFGVLRSGAFLLYNPGQYRPDLPQGLQWDSTDVVVMPASGDSAGVVARLPVLERLIGPGGRRLHMSPFGISVQAVAEDGFYWGTSDRYELRFHDPAGRVRRIIRRPVEPGLVEPSMIAEYEAAFLDRVRRFEGEAAVPRYRRSMEEGAYGDRVPLFGHAFVDGDQRLWISEAVWPSFDETPRRWTVFSPDGPWLGEVEAPDRLRLLDIREDLVLGVWLDPLDVQYVQVHRLVDA